MKWIRYVRLALEIFHNVKKSIVNIRLIGELNLDLVEVTERVLVVVVSSVIHATRSASSYEAKNESKVSQKAEDVSSRGF